MRNSRKKADLKKFRHTNLYKEIKHMCNLPATSKKPNECWSLAHGLMRRENGLMGYPLGSFTSNQQRCIANRFIPNKKVDRLMSLKTKVFVCKYDKNGSKLVTASQDSIVRIFDACKGTYQLKQRCKMHSDDWSVLDIDISRCGEYFTYSTWTKYFTVVSMETGTPQYARFSDYGNAMFSVRFSPCGEVIVGGCNNGQIFVYYRETGTIYMIPTIITLDHNAICYLSDQSSNLILTGCNDGLVKLWDLRCLHGTIYRSYRCNRFNIKPMSTFMGHLNAITYIDSRNDGQYFLTNSQDQCIKLWDIRQPASSHLVQKLHSIPPFIQRELRWDEPPFYDPNVVLRGDCSVMTYYGHRVSKTLLRAKFSPKNQTGQRYIYTGCSTGRIIIYDILTGQIKEAIESHRNVVRDVDWHPIRSEIVSASWDGQVNLNSYQRRPNLDQGQSNTSNQPLRRSQRIRNRTDYDDSDNEESSVPSYSYSYR